MSKSKLDQLTTKITEKATKKATKAISKLQDKTTKTILSVNKGVKDKFGVDIINNMEKINKRNELYQYFEDIQYESVCDSKYTKLNLTCIQGYILKLLLKKYKKKIIFREVSTGHIKLNLDNLLIYVSALKSKISITDKNLKNKIICVIENMKENINTAKAATQNTEENINKIFYQQICINGTPIMCNDANYNFKIPSSTASREPVSREIASQEPASRDHVSDTSDEKVVNCPSKDIDITKLPKCISEKDYKKQSIIIHPDKNLGCKDNATEKFQKLSQINERSQYFNYDINNCNRFTSKYDENILTDIHKLFKSDKTEAEISREAEAKTKVQAQAKTKGANGETYRDKYNCDKKYKIETKQLKKIFIDLVSK